MHRMPEEETGGLVRTRIDSLRHRLLDLSRRNPLISTRFSNRSNACVRVVDELPDQLLFTLRDRSDMAFAPLPSLDEDPRDEETKRFRDRLSEALLTDPVYLAAIDAIDPDGGDALEQARGVERQLRDRLRDELGMPPRQTRHDTSLAQHARINGISPSFELPPPSERRGDGLHDDDRIQTLLLPDTLDRTMTRLLTKFRTWEQETGINVFHAAFGFLEWGDGPQSQLSPLVLLKVRVERRKTHRGPEYRVRSAEEDPASNRVLAEALRVRLSLALPMYVGGSIEDYMGEVAALEPGGLVWRVRRFVAFGVFPSAQMSMFEDLAPDSLVPSEIVDSLLAGSGDAAASPFADEYRVDDPQIEARVPLLVADADSSQFGVLVDAADGRNLAVEGPPGTGKSQTIVNAIACALAAGKKVLFVAEKLAALDVVRSRLEAMGMGPYLLALQADRSTREGLIRSLRDRLDLPRPDRPQEIGRMREDFRNARDDLARYIRILASTYGGTGLTVHEVLGRSMKTSPVLDDAPKPLATPDVPNVSLLDAAALGELSIASSELAIAWETASSCGTAWSGLIMTEADRFTVDRVLDEAADAATAFDKLHQCSERLAAVAAPDRVDTDHAAGLTALGRPLAERMGDLDLELVERVLGQDASLVDDYLAQCKAYRSRSRQLRAILGASPDSGTVDRLDALIGIVRDYRLASPDTGAVDAEIERLLGEAASIGRDIESLGAFLDSVPALRSATLADLDAARRLVRATEREALALRSAGTTDPSLRSVIVQSARQGEALAGSWRAMARDFSLDAAPDPARLREAATTIRTTGLFGRLGARYRDAKRLYRSLSASHAWRRDHASRHLDDVAALLAERSAFEADPQRQSVFGPHFRGMMTDWPPFERAAAFAESVEARFDRLDQAPLRAFLLTGELFEITAIPECSRETARHGTLAAGALRETLSVIDERTTVLREAREALAAASPVPASPSNFGLDELRKLREDVAAHVRARKRLKKAKAVRRVLGPHFAGAGTTRDPIGDELSLARDLRNEDPGSAALMLALARRGALDAFLEAGVEFIDLRQDAQARVGKLLDETGVRFRGEADEAFHVTSARLRRACEDREGLVAHAGLGAAREVMRQTGFLWIADALVAAGRGLQRLDEVSAAVVARAMAIDVYRLHGRDLNRFSGHKLDTLRGRLASLDRELQELDRKELRALLHDRADPPAGNGRGRVGTFTEMGLVHHEVSKKGRFVSPRELTRRAGRALQELKPCWMMSPLAIAHYIRKGDVSFDLCIVDEASQMPPENAIGALMRSGQAMVVGDTNQLPPTSFFRMTLDDRDAEEDETVLNESILELANAAFRPKRRLRWHYRSRHSSLIGFSNRHVYNDDLIVFPGAFEDTPDMGVSLRKVEGLYRNSLNPVEADAVVAGVLKFMEDEPDRSLGVVTLNQRQRDLLNDRLAPAIDRSRTAQDYVQSWEKRRDGLEAFFVKNLENVQGDERDTIFISTVYGPETKGGPVANRFGPVNGIAGQRRLNVLFTRAKHRIVTFSSMTPPDIKAGTRERNAGAFLLRRWLEYSATGILEAGRETRREPDSAFEEFVIDRIEAMGCQAVPQVGVAGYFVDIGVRHPKWPHGYILGVECDGAAWHSSRSARDRDRLRQEVLEGLGWTFHRIWSTDWFNDPAREAERLLRRIDARLGELGEQAHFRWVSGETETGGVPDGGLDGATEDPEGEDGTFSHRLPPHAIGVQVGDTVQVRFLDDDGRVRRFTIGHDRHVPDAGVVHKDRPMARSVLNAEAGEEVEILVGSYLRRAVVEEVVQTGG